MTAARQAAAAARQAAAAAGPAEAPVAVRPVPALTRPRSSSVHQGNYCPQTWSSNRRPQHLAGARLQGCWAARDPARLVTKPVRTLCFVVLYYVRVAQPD